MGAIVLDAQGTWHVSAPGHKAKLDAFGASAPALARMAANLQSVLAECTSLAGARAMLGTMRSALAIHGFEGVFSYDTPAEFSRQVGAILAESVAVAARDRVHAQGASTVVRQRTRARLRKQFEDMGIFAKHIDEIDQHKVVHNYPVSAKHGLTAEFALKNSVMHITETVDFEVSEDSVRTKTFEAQAKCLVLRAAHDTFGNSTKCHIVVSGSSAKHAARSVDLLSTAGEVYATESAEDMRNYITHIAKAAGNPVMPVRH